MSMDGFFFPGGAADRRGRQGMGEKRDAERQRVHGYALSLCPYGAGVKERDAAGWMDVFYGDVRSEGRKGEESVHIDMCPLCDYFDGVTGQRERERNERARDKDKSLKRASMEGIYQECVCAGPPGRQAGKSGRPESISSWAHW